MSFVEHVWRKAAMTATVAAAVFFAVNVNVGGTKGPRHTSHVVAGNRQEYAQWRTKDHGGVNALFVLLSVYGYAGTYEDLSKATSNALPQTLLELLATSRRLGRPLTARSITPEQLSSVSLPVIVHVAGDNPDEGSFFVLLQVPHSKVVYLDGPSAAIFDMDKESFLRRWSGVVAFPASDAGADRLEVLIGILCGVGGAWYLIRRRRVYGASHNYL